MANAELRTFIESRLLALDPSIDLNPGSPAQTKFVDPLLTYLGTDPFETDIETFITDRLAQEFPEIYASDPGALRDVFMNPLRILLEPFKRETASIRRSQSLIDPTQLSDDDADALVANLFDVRDPGGYAYGIARLYYANPANSGVEITTRVYSKGNLSFFPTTPSTITAEEMAFNRDGSLYFFDVSVRAEKQGAEYNVDKEEIVGAEGVSNVVRVTNLRKFTGGSARQDTPTFVAAAEQSLTERSLVTRRGATARLNTVFKGDVRAVQVIGAKDVEMQRDILVGRVPGHAWLNGQVTLYQKLALVRCRVIDGQPESVPVQGDTIYIFLPVSKTVTTLTVEELLVGPSTDTAPYYKSYLLRWSGTLPAEVAVLPASFEGGVRKKGTVHVSSLPGGEAASLDVANEEVHVYGHADVYTRPTLQDITTTVIDGSYDLGPVGSTATYPWFSVERLTLLTTANSNAVTDSDGTFNFVNAGIVPGDLLVIESGPDAGSYRIGAVAAASMRLVDQLSATYGPARYRVVRGIRLDPFEPRALRFPFGSASQGVVFNDLQTTVGSDLVRLTSNDMLAHGAKVGDTVRILSGPDAGDYNITAFDTVLGGQGLFLSSKMTSTSANLRYEVFTAYNPVSKPLVRLREILLLDSAKQTTGVTVPLAQPLAVTPTGPFSSAKVLGVSHTTSGYVLPNLNGMLAGLTNTASVPPDKYSQHLVEFTGQYRASSFADASQAELPIPADAYNGCSYFLATCEITDDTENFPPIDPKTGDALTIKNGPNAGSYLIEDVLKFKYKVDVAGTKTAWIYLVKIYGTFPYDPIREIYDFVKNAGVATGMETGDITNPIVFPTFFTNWYTSLYNIGGGNGRLALALGALGITPPPVATVQQMVEKTCQVEYEWGTPARGVLRTYFREPTVFEEKTGTASAVTTFSYVSNTQTIRYRPDPTQYTKQELVPPRVETDADALAYPRNLDPSTMTFSGTDASMFVKGIKAGDVLSVHQEVFQLGDRMRQVLLQTVASSNQVTVPVSAGTVFTPAMTGYLLFIEEGPDKGGYRIVKYVDSRTVLLDRTMQASTPVVSMEGSAGNWGLDTGSNVVRQAGANFPLSVVGSYVTVYGIDYRWMGSFLVTSRPDSNTLVVAMPGATNFPAYPAAPAGTTRWIVTAAPTTAPSPVTRDPALAAQTGTETVAARPIRIYEAGPKDFPITAVINTDPRNVSQITVTGTVRLGFNQPYRIYRNNVRRVTPSEMDAHRDGPFCFFDTDVVSLTPDAAANIGLDTFLVVDEGTYGSVGYRHRVADPSLSYSTRETGFLDLPQGVLPVGTADSPENYISLYGMPIQISYERADLVRLFQEFLDSTQDRVLSADMLARHFLPAIVSYDATYVGGEDPSVIAADIISYIENLPVQTSLDLSVLEDLVANRGGNLDTPTKIVATIYDWNRRAWMEYSQNYLGGPEVTDTKVPYSGTPRVTYFIPGTDATGATTMPSGERINLVRR